MVKRNAIATKLTKRCTQTQKQAFDVAVHGVLTIQQYTIYLPLFNLCTSRESSLNSVKTVHSAVPPPSVRIFFIVHFVVITEIDYVHIIAFSFFSRFNYFAKTGPSTIHGLSIWVFVSLVQMCISHNTA